MTTFKTAALLFIAAVTVGAGAASAETRFQENHPRRAEVIGRAHHEIARINEQRREGEISGFQARRLRAADRHVINQEQRMAYRNGGYITRQQQVRLNREENHIGRHIPG